MWEGVNPAHRVELVGIGDDYVLARPGLPDLRVDRLRQRLLPGGPDLIEPVDPQRGGVDVATGRESGNRHRRVEVAAAPVGDVFKEERTRLRLRQAADLQTHEGYEFGVLVGPPRDRRQEIAPLELCQVVP